MKIRVTGTSEECACAQAFYRKLGQEPSVKYCTVSKPYPNRGDVNQYRVYIDIEYKDGAEPLHRMAESRELTPVSPTPRIGRPRRSVRKE